MPIRTPTLLALALTLVAGCGGRGTPGAGTPGAGTPSAGTPAAAGTARPTVDRAVAQVVTADGELRYPGVPQTLSFSASGKLTEVTVTAGQEVKAGDVIARIEPDALDVNLAEARANRIASQQQLDQLARGTDLERARQELERAKNNRWSVQAQRDAICGRARADCGDGDEFARQACKATREDSQTGCDQAEANTNAADQGVRIAELNLQDLEARQDTDRKAAQAKAEVSRLALARAERDHAGQALTAPFDGTISAVNVNAGIDIGPGSPVATLVQTRPLRFVTANLGERYVGEIRVGHKAKVILTSYPDRKLDATVQRVDSQGQRDQAGAVVFTVYLDVMPTDDLPVYAGMTGRAEIDVR
ncbi:MAG: HlyD family secretion protein [Anaerolineae bacterium]|nr:HlyD family efflux transporter periplasmic adaptor subunit [Ardenticatenia bacterium]HQZ70876.1 HlyD family efflux transporter periplasmic adaptor subunit [Anaerolineae bacterium]HRA19166.1 HlyD family efflux transporter periplasmic adaptor subunit [Anaerolineae bacterium]